MAAAECIHGHNLDEVGLYRSPSSGWPECMECRRRRRRESQNRLRKAERVPYNEDLDLDDLPGLVLKLVQGIKTMTETDELGTYQRRLF